MSPRKGGFRHLIYFIDGTWLWPGSDRTLDVYSNIYRLNTLLNADDATGHAQIIHYSRGLGAVTGIRKYTSGGFAYGIDELVADLYINICSNHEPGDKLYIFGFSRGAVVARALSGLLSKGILDARHVNMFAHVWADYIGANEITVPGLPGDVRSKISIAEYKAKCSETNPKIEFLGVFDTVAGGHGLTEVAQRLRLNERKVDANVKNAVQILAIDEQRNFFRPIMWTGKRDPKTYLEQIWMPGVHSDVGGAYGNRILGNISLLTMIDRVVEKTDLSFDKEECARYLAKPPAGTLPLIHNEYTRWWTMFSPSPQQRSVDTEIEQFIHPYAKWLDRQVVIYKGHTKHVRYSLPEHFAQLPVAPETISGIFKGLVPT
ncbi:DUF2235 domain-containing protein [Bradyrhizobium sp. ARR65]|uniref:T6SS phospholipase effector Tle1-like catalytic domain-containing protein n=1 Tax=Bradyrhizobium sp. ARR65 TaxID=1040989 RepID=UPI000463F2C7|nr:DUF2235 domain-containing protein [Bradyrhizobium sp. ARR65]